MRAAAKPANAANLCELAEFLMRHEESHDTETALPDVEMANDAARSIEQLRIQLGQQLFDLNECFIRCLLSDDGHLVRSLEFR